MPIPWLTVLKSVPWIEVIRNAPKVVDAARRFWVTVRAERRPEQATLTPPVRPQEGTGGEHAVLRARVDALEGELEAVREQVMTSAELIRQLAEQNSGLIARVERNRRRMVWLAIASAISLVVAIAAIWVARRI
jgi:hypothetical protein